VIGSLLWSKLSSAPNDGSWPTGAGLTIPLHRCAAPNTDRGEFADTGDAVVGFSTQTPKRGSHPASFPLTPARPSATSRTPGVPNT
jgi:hypothetical protein